MARKRSLHPATKRLAGAAPENELGAAAPSGLIAAAAVFLAAFALLIWFHALPASQRADRRAQAAGRAIELALERYARDHSGIYPKTGDVTGGPADALIRSRAMAFYPPNPHHPERTMKNVPFGTFSPGDFSYMRDPDKAYEYSLTVYAGTPRRGPLKDGVAFMHRKNP